MHLLIVIGLQQNNAMKYDKFIESYSTVLASYKKEPQRLDTFYFTLLTNSEQHGPLLSIIKQLLLLTLVMVKLQ
jgi:hypothetical protein